MYGVPFWLVLIYIFICAFLFCFVGNFLNPRSLRLRLFSKDWWGFVFRMVIIFSILIVVQSLFIKMKRGAPMENEVNLGPLKSIGYIGTILVALTFYLKQKSIKKLIYWVAGLSILLVNLYYFFISDIRGFRTYGGLLFGIFILVYGPTGILDRYIEQAKERIQKGKTSK